MNPPVRAGRLAEGGKATSFNGVSREERHLYAARSIDAFSAWATARTSSTNASSFL